MPAYPPSMMEVVSPTSVAAPCRLEETAMEISIATGEIPSFFAIARPTGAIISTVATLSTKAETTPANSDIATATHITFGVFLRIISAIRLGIWDWMKRETVPIVPASIRRTLKSMASLSEASGTIPLTRNTTALVSATQGRCFGSAIISA